MSCPNVSQHANKSFAMFDSVFDANCWKYRVQRWKKNIVWSKLTDFIDVLSAVWCDEEGKKIQMSAQMIF